MYALRRFDMGSGTGLLISVGEYMLVIAICCIYLALLWANSV